jgi:hypothetical protein
VITRGLAIGMTVLTVALTALWEVAILLGGGTILSLAGMAPVALWLIMAALIAVTENRAKTDMVRLAVPQRTKERVR